MRKYTKSKNRKLEWLLAPDVKKRIGKLLKICEVTWVKPSKIYCFRSLNAKSRAIGRIWGLSRIWQIALERKPAYIVEVISEKFDRLDELEKDKVLLHELTHIPKNFSGALIPHIRRGKRSFHDKVHVLIVQYLAKRDL